MDVKNFFLNSDFIEEVYMRLLQVISILQISFANFVVPFMDLSKPHPHLLGLPNFILFFVLKRLILKLRKGKHISIPCLMNKVR
jgi:hypothetical protein